jgi:hypothetical protein
MEKWLYFLMFLCVFDLFVYEFLGWFSRVVVFQRVDDEGAAVFNWMV